MTLTFRSLFSDNGGSDLNVYLNQVDYIDWKISTLSLDLNGDDFMIFVMLWQHISHKLAGDRKNSE